ncbi:MAG: SDR family NAD(P)-dependent oxidoreductase, partial [Deltaproteobacteria bacterium]|nr:SDR family NAD(P)-dependent oxidoreductase [Deltaproteobacteria bacterium]
MKLQGNTILLTGGSAGIGLALAKEFLALGNKVIITGRNADK